MRSYHRILFAPGPLYPLQPSKLKNGHSFYCRFWFFGQLNWYEIWKMKIAKLKAYRLAFQRYQNYQDLIGLRWVMARETRKICTKCLKTFNNSLKTYNNIKLLMINVLRLKGNKSVGKSFKYTFYQDQMG